MTDYRGYIERNGEEFEVTAELYDEGYGYSDYWSDIGYSFEVEKEPTFKKFYAEDQDGNSFALTVEEISRATDQMIKQYWENY